MTNSQLVSLKNTRNEWRRSRSTLETSGEDQELHSKRVEKIKNHTLNEKIRNYTRNEWRRSGTTLEMSGEDQKTTHETSGEDQEPHSKRVEKIRNYTRNEWRRSKNYTLNEWRR